MVLYNPQKIEKEILSFWDKEDIFGKLKRNLSKSKKRFSFLDGPITANNPMGVHHASGRTYKDLFLRFKAMQGYNQRWQNGFDCQGLWVEREVEKEKGFKSKKDIEEYGLLNFSEACKARVFKYAKLITEDSIKLGQWMNWGEDYYTMSDVNNLHNWHLLKEYFKKGWLYKGKDVVPWCARCGTASSKHDILTEGYKEIEQVGIYMRFPIKGRSNEYLLIFTTTPWTIPANVAVAVGENVTYVKVKQDSKYYWLAEKRLNILKGDYKVVSKITGRNLVGLEYDMPYYKLHVQKGNPHTIVSWDLASEEEGTGMVHVAPGCGPEDYALGKLKKLNALSPLDENGIYKEGYSWLSGRPAKELNPKIIVDIKKRGFLYKTEMVRHRYPHCWRCQNELVFRLVDEWYISCKYIRNNLKKENKKIEWYPAYGKERQERWFNDMSDWLVSQKRFWGLPLPIWECSCGNVEVIGSIKELRKKAVSGIPQLKELHRPWIDNVLLKCPKCSNAVKRIPDIGMTWLDGGITPFSTIGPYLKDKAYWKKWYPADFITENLPGQYRGWFNAIMWSGVFLTGKAPFKSLFGYEMIKDEKGREMHKSWGNAIWARDALAKIGADPLRLRFCLQDPSKEIWFGYSSCDETKKTLNILLNTANYLKINLDKKPKKPKLVSTIDKWILSRVESTKIKVTEELENLHPHIAAEELENFILYDLSRMYGQAIRNRINNSKDKEKVRYVFYYCLLEAIKLLAPMIPFTTEKIYQDIFKEYEKIDSIHLFDWPKPNTRLINKELESDIEIVKEILSSGLAAREQANRTLRWPVKKITIVSSKQKIHMAVKKHNNLLKVALNSLDVDVSNKLSGMDYEIKLNYAKAGPYFGSEVSRVAEYLNSKPASKIISEIQNKGSYVKLKSTKGGKIGISKDLLIIREKLPMGIVGRQTKDSTLYIDTNETQDMINSGFIREISRKVQDLRKKSKLSTEDGILIELCVSDDLKSMIEDKTIELIDGTKTKSILFVSRLSKPKRSSFTVRGKKIGLAICKV